MFHGIISLFLIVSSLSCNFNRLSVPFVFIVHDFSSRTTLFYVPLRLFPNRGLFHDMVQLNTASIVSVIQAPIIKTSLGSFVGTVCNLDVSSLLDGSCNCCTCTQCLLNCYRHYHTSFLLSYVCIFLNCQIFTLIL